MMVLKKYMKKTIHVKFVPLNNTADDDDEGWRMENEKRRRKFDKELNNHDSVINGLNLCETAVETPFWRVLKSEQSVICTYHLCRLNFL